MKPLRIRERGVGFLYYIVAIAAAITLSGCPGPPSPQPTVREEEISGIGKGVVTPARNTEGAGLLSAFFFKFLHDDHPLQTIAAHPLLGSTMEVAFADRDPSAADDEYTYTIIYQHVTDPGIIVKSASQSTCSGTCALFDQQLADCESRGECVFVLRGFKFNYPSDDFAVQNVAILESNGAINVRLHDRSSNTRPFAVTVDYALVPKALITSSASIQGQSKGATRQPIPSGTATLSGFSIQTFGDDFRLLELGVLARQPANTGPNVEVYFGDRGQNTDFLYKVMYNIMNVRK